MHISFQSALEELKNSSKLFSTILKHESVLVELYKPTGDDSQTPHEKDELYIVASGSGDLILGTQTLPFTTGDMFYVPAFVEHKFINFTNDFSTWVIFFGLTEGEKYSFSNDHEDEL